MQSNKKKWFWIVLAIGVFVLLLIVPFIFPIVATGSELKTLTELDISCTDILAKQKETEIERKADEWFQSLQFPATSRNHYTLVSHQGTWSSFCKAYEQALQDNEEWVSDPVKIALRLAGYPNDDHLSPDNVSTYYSNKSSKIVSVIVLSTNLMDDSIKDKEYRVDLLEENNSWRIQWAGYRQRCWRGFLGGWTRGFCP